MLRLTLLLIFGAPCALAAPKAIKVISAHPDKGKQDGRVVPGAVAAFDFVGEGGARIAAGGNDHHVRVFKVSDKREVYQSKRLKRPIMHVHGSQSGRFIAQRTDGKIHGFRPRSKGKAYAARPSIDHDGAGRAWITASGRWIVADGGKDFAIYDAKSGRWRGLFGAKRLRHPQSSRLSGDQIMHLTQARDGLTSGVIRSMQEGSERGPSYPMALKDPQLGTLVQAWYYTNQDWLTEYCAEDACTVTLYDGQSNVRAEMTFDTKASAWGGHVPSKIAVSSDSAWMFFYRARLQGEVVRLKDKKSYLLGELQRTDDADPMAAFSPTNPKLLAVSMIPKPHQITLYEISE